MTKSFHHFGVLGAGAWGTALAVTMARAGRAVTLWARRPELAATLHQQRVNEKYLPGVRLAPEIVITSDMAALAGCDLWLIATPAQQVRALCQRLCTELPVQPRPILLTSKGIEQTSGLLLSEILAEALPQPPLAILSGPSFAAEVAAGKPVALTLAVKDQDLGARLTAALATPGFRLYLSDDLIGAQIGGAIKNVLAIACGITVGRALGENARAAIITRGLAEIMRLGTAVGGRAETLMGLSGLGDLVLTCCGAQSRNMSLGIALGQGKSLAEILAARSSVAEGVTTAGAALELARKHHVEMPIVSAVAAVLQGASDIESAIAQLLARPLKSEQG